jgi:hypothetical protein
VHDVIGCRGTIRQEGEQSRRQQQAAEHGFDEAGTIS